MADRQRDRLPVPDRLLGTLMADEKEIASYAFVFSIVLAQAIVVSAVYLIVKLVISYS